jgi:putative toxin-antitoxin system antitoxin component (TIGR02293 family)
MVDQVKHKAASSKKKVPLKKEFENVPLETEVFSSRVMETPPAESGGYAVMQSIVKQFVPSGAGHPAAVGSLIDTVLNGLPFSELVALRELLGQPLEQLAGNLGISRATLHRRKHAGRLEQGESDRVVRYARLMGKATEVFGSVEQARQWLGFPQFGLGNATPLDYARTEIGAREVENLLGRIEHGVYS